MPETVKSFLFGPFLLDMEQRLLLRDGKPVPLPPKAVVILCVLAENHGKLVERDELMKLVWPNVFVEEGNLTVNVFALRKVLAEGLNGASCIETIPRRGYRLVIPLKESFGPADAGVRIPDSAETSPVPPNEAVAPLNTPAPSYQTRQQVTETLGASLPRRLFLLLGVGAILVALLAWKVLIPPASPRVLHVVQLTHLGLASSVVTDGARLYVGEEKDGRSSIVQVPIEGGDPTPISTPFRSVRILDISPNRSELLVDSHESASDPWLAWILPLAGGSPRRLGDVTAISARWSPDGSRIAFEREEDGALCTANSDGSDVRKVLEDAGGVDSWSPDGRLLRFTRTNRATGGMSLWEVQLDGTNLRSVFLERQNPNARWGEGQCCGGRTPDGRYYLFREAFNYKAGLWAVRENKGLFQLRRPEPIEIYAAGFDIGNPVLSPDGRRAYLYGKNESRELVRYDRNMRQFVPFLSGTSVMFVSWSPNGEWLAYTTYPEGCLWRARRDGSERVQLTFPPMQAYGIAWSPDSQRLEFHALWPGKPGKICLLSAQGGTPEVLFANESTAEDVPNWSPDGNTLMFSRSSLDKDGRTTESSICMFDLKTRHLIQLPGGEAMGAPVWSPDGRYVAAPSDDSSKLMLFDMHSQKWKRLANGGFIHLPTWSRDSGAIYFQDLSGGEGQPVYQVGVPGGKVEEVAGRRQFLRTDISRFMLVGLTPDNDPVAVVIRENADIYALDLDLP